MSPRKTNAEAYLRMYRQMVRIRVFEDNANQLYLSARMPGLTHMYSGQEAVAVGICEALTRDDKITSTHRGHGHCVAKGAEFKEMFCELLGRAEGYCGGKGGSMHIADQSNGNLGANAIVGGSMGIATGAALSAKRLGRKDVTVCFFGDGATAQGLLYEVMNMAALWKLPVIYACENNGYSEYTKTAEIAAGSLLARAEAFGIEAFQVDGQDVLAVNELTERLKASFVKNHGLQCGFCTPGMIISAREMITRNPAMEESELRQDMSGNLCRCTGFSGIVNAIKEAAEAHRRASQ